MFHVPNNRRVTVGPMGSSNDYGNNGLFLIPYRKHKDTYAKIKVIASDGKGWEHVSASLPGRCPTWLEMCRIKDLFWDLDDAVIQIHPVAGDYVNNHPNCLHLWRKAGTNKYFEAPPMILV